MILKIISVPLETLMSNVVFNFQDLVDTTRLKLYQIKTYKNRDICLPDIKINYSDLITCLVPT